MVVTKVDEDKRQVFGWASVAAVDGQPVVDKQDDIIPVDELEKAAYDFVLYSRRQGEMHSLIGTGRLIESMVHNAEKRACGVVAKDADGREIDGWWVGFQVDHEASWRAIKSGGLPEFSIGGSASGDE